LVLGRQACLDLLPNGRLIEQRASDAKRDM